MSDSSSSTDAEGLVAPPVFSKNGYHYRLLAAREGVALYAQSKVESATEVFEVVILRYRPEQEVCGKVVPAGVRLPSNEEWGAYGWTYRNREAAEGRFEEIIQERRTKRQVVVDEEGV